MKLEEEIQTMFDKYPLLFQERWETLNHLFCVIGNGYEWIDGELIPDSYKDENGKYVCRYIRKEDSDEFLLNPAFKYQFKGALGPDGKAIQRNTTSEDAKKYYSMKKFREMHKEPARFPKWYPICKHSRLMTFDPDNIKPDWFAGIMEVKGLLAADEIFL